MRKVLIAKVLSAMLVLICPNSLLSLLQIPAKKGEVLKFGHKWRHHQLKTFLYMKKQGKKTLAKMLKKISRVALIFSTFSRFAAEGSLKNLASIEAKISFPESNLKSYQVKNWIFSTFKYFFNAFCNPC